MKSQTPHVKKHMNIQKRLLFFLFIAVAAVLLLEFQKRVPLPAPKIEIITPEMRLADDTEFTLPDLTGNMTRFSDFKGNVVLLNFFATWCSPCRKETPSLEQLFRKYKQKDFVIVGVAGDTQGKEVVEPFVKEYEVTFPVVLDTQNEVLKQYNVGGIPTIYMFDRQGRIAAKHVGGANWNSETIHALIDQLLQES